MAEIKRLVFAIIEFLDDQIVCGELTEDAVESLEGKLINFLCWVPLNY
jgi:hypothetical protein